MRISLLPRDRRFFALFDKQAESVVAAADLLDASFREPSQLATAQVDIKNLEHQGDDQTHEIVDTLNRTFVTPFDREDIFALSSGLDDILDFIDEIADTVSLYAITTIPDGAREMTGYLRLAAEQVRQAVHSLEAGTALREHGIEIHRLENLGDATSRHAIGELFSGSYDALDVIKLKQLYTLLEDALDRCEDVANTLESIAIKNA